MDRKIRAEKTADFFSAKNNIMYILHRNFRLVIGSNENKN